MKKEKEESAVEACRRIVADTASCSVKPPALFSNITVLTVPGTTIEEEKKQSKY